MLGDKFHGEVQTEAEEQGRLGVGKQEGNWQGAIWVMTWGRRRGEQHQMGSGRDVQPEASPTQSVGGSVPSLLRDSKGAKMAAAGAGRRVPWRERETAVFVDTSKSL